MQFRQDRDADKLLRTRSEFVDSLVIQAAETHLLSQTDVPIAVLAVGGYGRAELFPHSDVDILLLVTAERDVPVFPDPLSIFLRVLWDSNLRLSHSVRTLTECCRLHDGNAELNVSLLDLRFLAGSRSLYDSLCTGLAEVPARQSAELARRLIELTLRRHAKFNNTVYHLEPNVKETPGAIRDLQVLRWLATLFPASEALGELRTSLEGATQKQLSAKAFLFMIRAFLHLKAGRDSNLLTFELQDDAARNLAAKPLAPEEWMRMYFSQARRIFHAAERALEFVDNQEQSLFRQFRDRKSRLSTPDFTVSRNRVYLRNPGEILRSATSVVQLFTFVGRHGIRISWDTHRRLQPELERLADQFSEGAVKWAAWADLFSQPHAGSALEDMHEAGLLNAAMPEWKSIESLVVRDFYHRYTVDEHTLVAINHIDSLLANEQPAARRFHQLAVEDPDPANLRLALLLHDVGKGVQPGNHVRGSIEAAKDILVRFHAPADKTREVLFLIEHHLDLSLIMNGRDLEDPATGRFLTSRVGTQEDLRRLTLLTFADISAVNPTAMTPWRVEQLWRVYGLGVEQLRRELASDRIHQQSVTEPRRFGQPDLIEFLEGFPKRYVRIHTDDQIRHHLALAQKSKREGVAVEIGAEAGAYSLTVLAHDKPGLFSALCGTLASFGMNIVRGEASSNDAGCILDMIRFSDPNRTLELNPDEVHRLEWTIACVVRGSVSVTDLLKRRRPLARPTSDAVIVPSVRFNNDASDTSTLIDFVGEDRPGLLYDLTSVITRAGCNLEVVMIDTEAHKAIDVFYVTCRGDKLDESAQEGLRAELERVAVPA